MHGDSLPSAYFENSSIADVEIKQTKSCYKNVTEFAFSFCFNLQEFDHPHVLLKNENGYLYRMVQQTGHSMAESLFRTAQMVCEKVLKKLQCSKNVIKWCEDHTR
jgi:hypothetical protein